MSIFSSCLWGVVWETQKKIWCFSSEKGVMQRAQTQSLTGTRRTQFHQLMPVLLQGFHACQFIFFMIQIIIFLCSDEDVFFQDFLAEANSWLQQPHTIILPPPVSFITDLFLFSLITPQNLCAEIWWSPYFLLWDVSQSLSLSHNWSPWFGSNFDVFILDWYICKTATKNKNSQKIISFANLEKRLVYTKPGVM